MNSPVIKIMPLLVLLLLIVGTVLGQAPQQLNYQAVVRTNSGQPVTGGTSVKLRFTIHDITATGSAVYTETDNTTANQFGLVNIQIGSTGNLSTVNWGNGSKYLQVETDINNTGSFADMGASQLISVPYALYAGNSAMGPQGPTGAAGAQGPTGGVGPTGVNGAAGPMGIPGATGPQGLEGATGADGPQGLPGSASATGATGPQGLAGADGTTGPQGPAGAQGAAGIDGATGPQGIQGLTGAAGPQGLAGIDGATGLQGIQGIQGVTGVAGPQGVAGVDGATGLQGIQGATGSQGIQGVTGPTGLQGSDGATGATGFLSSGTTAGNTTYWNGTNWVLNSSNIYNNGGNVGIGTALPGAKLEVAGQVKITGGTPGSTKVLTSDATGLGSWTRGSFRYQIINENYGATDNTVGPTIGINDGFTMFGSITNTVCNSPNASTLKVDYNNGLLFATTTSGTLTIGGNGTNTVTVSHSDGGCGYSNVLTITSASGQIRMFTTTNNGYFRFRFALDVLILSRDS